MMTEMDKPEDLIALNLELVKQKIDQAALSAGRSSNEVNLVVVSKGQTVGVIRAALNAGIKTYGENYPEETLKKIQTLQGHQGIEWHMIGHLQSRKARIVAENFSMVHSLDSIHLAIKLDKILGEQNKMMPVMLECNVSREDTKYGWPAWEESQWQALIPDVIAILNCKFLVLVGLMTMPPLFQDIESARPYFQKLAALKEFLSREISGEHFKELSMGTSSDYPIAIQEGATYIRIGQAILGPRPDYHHIEENFFENQYNKQDK
jgi:PLP dependent protein